MARRSSKIAIVAVLATSVFVEADSSVFSKFIGSTVASNPSPAASLAFTQCTNALHDLPALTGLTPAFSTQVDQEAVDIVCQACTSLGQSRIDSCCPQATSSACFDAFAAGNAAPSPTPAMTTASGNTPATTTPATSAPSATKSSAAHPLRIHNGLLAGSLCCTLGVGGWLLSLAI